LTAIHSGLSMGLLAIIKAIDYKALICIKRRLVWQRLLGLTLEPPILAWR
jgi:hypothetical protein